MPVSVSVDHTRQVVHTEASGLFTYDDVMRHLYEERNIGGLAYREILDATHATAAFDGASLLQLVDLIRLIAPREAFGPTAVIVADDVSYGMVRMLGILVEDVCDIRPFRPTERSAADAWVATARIREKGKIVSQSIE
jgi:hypothetical protein